jgi:hypothetical protein
MPAKKKTTKKKTTKKKTTAKKAKKVYVCVPCGTEVTLTREGMGVTRLMCCGEVMKAKRSASCKRC